MRTLRLIVPTVLFAAVLVGCITQAASYSSQNPRNVKPPPVEEGAAPQPTATPALSAPTLSAQQTGAEEATVSWNAVDDATGYQLQRQDSGNPWGSVDGVIQTTTSGAYDQAPGTTYNYRVRAVNDDGVSPWSAVLQVTLLARMPTPKP